MTRILIVYASNYGNTESMARQVARGVEEVTDVEAVLRTVAPVDPSAEASDSAPIVEIDELGECDGLIIGSPTHFGNMTASMKHFIDSTTAAWMNGALVGKPAGVFASTGSLHGGQESTLLSMMLPLLHHGMVIAGLPYTHPELMATQSGGTPYGPTHVAGPASDRPLTAEEKTLCRGLGRRIGELAKKLG
ncbi:MAG: NAD(P)H:quinone oxidoreductase [Pseudomonadota bacterium]